MRCNSCLSNDFGNYLTYLDITLLKCRQCGLIFVKDIPDSETIASYYQDEFYDKEKSQRFSKLFEDILRLLRHLRVSAVHSFCKTPGNMVDLGFSRGTTMKLLKSKGWKTFGTQISVNAYKHAKENGLDVFLGELSKAKIKAKSIDLVTFWNVLEHVRDPSSYVRETNRILRRNGKVIIELPNAGSPIAKLFKAKWFNLDLPRHLYHFSNKSLTILLQRNGFKVVKRKYFSLEPSIFSLLQSFLNLINRRPNVLFETIKKNKKIGLGLTIYNWLLALIFLFPALILAFIMSWLNLGDMLIFYCVKVRDATDK